MKKGLRLCPWAVGGGGAHGNQSLGTAFEGAPRARSFYYPLCPASRYKGNAEHASTPDCARRLMRAILGARCICSCRGRWWVDRMQLQPTFAAGYQAFKCSTRLLRRGVHLEATLQAHVGSIGLQLIGYG